MRLPDDVLPAHVKAARQVAKKVPDSPASRARVVAVALVGPEIPQRPRMGPIAMSPNWVTSRKGNFR